MNLPRLHSEVVIAAIAGAGVAHHLGTSTTHHLNATAFELLESCDGRTPMAAKVASWVERFGVPAAVVDDEVRRSLDQFRRIGLLDDSGTPPPGASPGSDTMGDHVDREIEAARTDPGRWPVEGMVHRLHDVGVRFHGEDAELVALVDDFLATGDPTLDATIHIGLEAAQDGGVVVHAGTPWHFERWEHLEDQLVAVLDEYATSATGCVVLHAGAVRSREGLTVVLAGVSGAGKSTTTAALVRAGWEYLGDESVGVDARDLSVLPYAKPLRLDARSRELLGLPASARSCTRPSELTEEAVPVGATCDGSAPVAGPGIVDLVVVLSPDAPRQGCDGRIQEVDLRDAVDLLLPHAFHSGLRVPGGFQTICDLAETVPIVRLEVGAAVEVGAAGGPEVARPSLDEVVAHIESYAGSLERTS